MEKILVLDSEPVVRRLIAAILEGEGYSVSATASLDDAISSIKADRPALVITNVALPRVTGHDAMYLLKSQFPALPVLMVSGLPDAEVIDRWCGEAGFDVFPKPFKPAELISKVREMLKSGSGSHGSYIRQMPGD